MAFMNFAAAFGHLRLSDITVYIPIAIEIMVGLLI